MVYSSVKHYSMPTFMFSSIQIQQIEFETVYNWTHLIFLVVQTLFTDMQNPYRNIFGSVQVLGPLRKATNDSSIQRMPLVLNSASSTVDGLNSMHKFSGCYSHRYIAETRYASDLTTSIPRTKFWTLLLVPSNTPFFPNHVWPALRQLSLHQDWSLRLLSRGFDTSSFH